VDGCEAAGWGEDGARAAQLRVAWRFAGAFADAAGRPRFVELEAW
jgi:hypothetical protein